MDDLVLNVGKNIFSPIKEFINCVLGKNINYWYQKLEKQELKFMKKQKFMLIQNMMK